MKTKKREIKQRIVATLVALFMFVMIFGSVSVDFTSAIGTNTTLLQNLIPGALSMEAPSSLLFSDISIGTAVNSTANMLQVNARDYRGSGVPWSVTGTMNNLTVADAGVNNISNNTIAWAPGGYFSDNGTDTGVALGVAGYFDSARALFNTAWNSGMGNYRIVNTVFNVVYNGATDFQNGLYQNTLTMIIA